MNASLVVLAAGMGRRFGGLKQMEGVGPNNEVLSHYSAYDAYREGFSKIIYIIKPDMESDFIEKVASKIDFLPYEIVFQSMDLPFGYSTPKNRIKPWGTSHALLCCKDAIKEPFMIINADDFYGRDSYKIIYEFLKDTKSEENSHCLAGYNLIDTITENGSVSRGVCIVENEYLKSIVERTNIEKKEDKIVYFENNEFLEIPKDSIASMNAFGFKPSIFKELEDGFKSFLSKNIDSDSAEYFLPKTVQEMLNSKSSTIKVLQTRGKWYGFTYKEDQKIVQNAIKEMILEGKYPSKL